MIHMIHPIQCKYTGDDKYMRDGIERKKWYTVVGYEARNVEKEFEGKKKWIDELFYLVINDQGKMVVIASFNCSVRIDQQSEIPGTQIAGLMSNLLSLVKVWSEKHENSGKDDS